MDYDDKRASRNIEIDCLGKRVPIISPEGKAGLKCQAEVAEFAEQAVTSMMQRALKKGFLSISEPASTASVYWALNQTIIQSQDIYAAGKNSPSL